MAPINVDTLLDAASAPAGRFAGIRHRLSSEVG